MNKNRKKARRVREGGEASHMARKGARKRAARQARLVSDADEPREQKVARALKSGGLTHRHLAALNGGAPRWSDPHLGYLRRFHPWILSLPLDGGGTEDAGDVLWGIYGKAPNLFCAECADAFHLLFLLRDRWVRPAGTWKRAKKGRWSRLKNLIAHLLCRYPVPDFLFNMFYRGVARHDAQQRDLFLHLAGGGSLKKLSPTVLPIKLTNRMRALWMRSPANLDVIDAFRLAQVRALGGRPPLARALSRHHDSYEQAEGEAFLFSVFQWFCQQPLLDPAKVGPLCDYIDHRRREEPGFSMRGRSALALLRGMEAWHAELALAAQARYVAGEFDPSGFGGMTRIRRERDHATGDLVEVTYSITEVLTKKGLAREGRALRHCVFSYACTVQQKVSSIWSLRRMGERLVTIEVGNRDRLVRQVRGKHNRAPTPAEDAMVDRWAAQNGLRRGRSGW